jgi:hypothetical protein
MSAKELEPLDYLVKLIHSDSIIRAVDGAKKETVWNSGS